MGGQGRQTMPSIRDKILVRLPVIAGKLLIQRTISWHPSPETISARIGC